MQLFDKKTQKVFYEKLTYVYLEMPKFNKTEDELETRFDKWLNILKNLEDLSKRPAKLQEKIFNKLFDQAEIARYSDKEYAEYEDSLKFYRDLKNSIDTAFDEGVVFGIEQGIEQGKKNTSIEVARSLKLNRFQHGDIYEVTGLSIDDIEKL